MCRLDGPVDVRGRWCFERVTNVHNETVKWVYRGDLLDKVPDELNWHGTKWDGGEESLLQRKGMIKLTLSERGTEVRWPLFAANWTSLFYVMEWLRTAPGPYTLKYFIVGWVEEKFDDVNAAINRIDQLLSKSDVHLTQRTFVKEQDPSRARVPDLLRHALLDETIMPDVSVDCVLDDTSGRFKVDRIGADSTIAKMWGMSPVSYPVRSSHSYAHMVSQAYMKVLKTDEPHYDHIYAAMETADKNVLWIPYQRVVLPHRFPDRRKGVSVVTALADVDISII